MRIACYLLCCYCYHEKMSEDIWQPLNASYMQWPQRPHALRIFYQQEWHPYQVGTSKLLSVLLATPRKTALYVSLLILLLTAPFSTSFLTISYSPNSLATINIVSPSLDPVFSLRSLSIHVVYPKLVEAPPIPFLG